jgi:hypothetical protein
LPAGAPTASRSKTTTVVILAADLIQAHCGNQDVPGHGNLQIKRVQQNPALLKYTPTFPGTVHIDEVLDERRALLERCACTQRDGLGLRQHKGAAGALIAPIGFAAAGHADGSMGSASRRQAFRPDFVRLRQGSQMPNGPGHYVTVAVQVSIAPDSGLEHFRDVTGDECEDRYQVRSLILTSHLPVTRWHEQIGDPTVAGR